MTENWKPSPQLVTKQTETRSDKSEDLAVKIMTLAVEHAKGRNLDSIGLTADAERIWQWVTSDTWDSARGVP